MKKLLIEILIGMAAGAAMIAIDSGLGLFTSFNSASNTTIAGTASNESKACVALEDCWQHKTEFILSIQTNGEFYGQCTKG